MVPLFKDATGNPSKRGTDRSRRGFLKRALAAGGVAGLAGFVASCGGTEGDEATRPTGEVQTPTGENPKPGLSEEVVDCRSTEQLSPQDLKVRQALNYTPDSPEEGERCDNCQFYKPPARGDTSNVAASGKNAACGGCVHFAGPVTDGGWCTVWAAQQQS